MENRKPCGNCDVGVYNEIALLNKHAIKFMSIDENEREKRIPKCKTRDIPCVGYCDVHKLKSSADLAFKKLEAKDDVYNHADN